MNEDEEKGASLNNNGCIPVCHVEDVAKTNNHPDSKCHAKRHFDDTTLHIDGEFSNAEGKVCANVMFGIIGKDVDGLIFNTNASLKQSMSSRTSIPERILLDSQCTIDLFSNHELLHNIHPIKTTTHIKCNARSKSIIFMVISLVTDGFGTFPTELPTFSHLVM